MRKHDRLKSGESKSYKDLKIWRKGIELVKVVYAQCGQMPNEEVYGLQSQVKRSSISIPSNIAEGYGRSSTKDYARFLKIARGSLLELETQFIIAKELNLINESGFKAVEEIIIEEGKMLNAYIKTLEKNIK